MQRNNTGVVSVSMELLRLRLPSNDGTLCKICGFHGGDYEEWRPLGCYAL
jgi:hypothetical protein